MKQENISVDLRYTLWNSLRHPLVKQENISVDLRYTLWDSLRHPLGYSLWDSVVCLLMDSIGIDYNILF